MVRNALPLIAILFVGAAVRYPLAFTRPQFYTSDTAVLDLMARHFLKGEWAFYYWGQRYYGAADTILLMPLFRLFGKTVPVVEIVPFAAAAVLLALFHHYVCKECGVRIAGAATLLLAVPSAVYLRCTFVTFEYAIGPSLGIAHLILARRLNLNAAARWFWIGLCAGFSYFYFPMITVFWAGLVLRLAIVRLLDVRCRKKQDVAARTMGRSAGARCLLVLGAGFVMGYAPAIAGSVARQPPQTPAAWVGVSTLAQNVQRFATEIVPAMISSNPHLLWMLVCADLLCVGLGYVAIRPVHWLWVQVRRGSAGHLPALILVGWANGLAVILGTELQDPWHLRYFLPLMMATALGIAICLSWLANHARGVALAVLALFVGNNLVGDVTLARGGSAADPLKIVAERLITRGYRAGYADYWIAYRITALADERLIVDPSSGIERYLRYLDFVRSQRRVVYLSWTPIESAGELEIKGARYRIIGQESVKGLWIDYLERASESNPNLAVTSFADACRLPARPGR